MPVEVPQLGHDGSKLKDNGLVIPKVDIPKTPEEIINSADWEIFPFDNNPVAGAVVHWGVEVTNNDLADLLNSRGKHTIQGQPFKGEDFSSTGFKSRYMYPVSTTKEEAAFIEKTIAVQTVQRTCDARGISPEEVDVFYFCSSLPGDPKTPEKNAKLGHEVAELAGLSKAKVMQISLACNSTAEAMRLIGVRQEELRGKYALIIANEGLAKEGRLDNDGIDPTGSSIFSNGGVGAAFKVGEDFTIIPGLFEVIEDYESITAPLYFPFKANTDNGLMITDNEIRQRPANPEGLNYALMIAKLTSLWFTKPVMQSLDRSIRYFKSKGLFDYFIKTGKAISTLMHHASQTLYDSVPKRIKRNPFNHEDLNLDVKWYVEKGNDSCGTFLEGVLKAGNQGLLTPEQVIFGWGFGVWANTSSLILQDFQPR